MRVFHTCLLFATLATSTSCTTIKRNVDAEVVDVVSEPAIGERVIASIGDRMVSQGVLVREQVLRVRAPAGGSLYGIPAMDYLKIGEDEKLSFFDGSLVQLRSGLADPPRALAIPKEPNGRIIVVTVSGTTTSYEADFVETTRFSNARQSLQKTLIYSGRVGDRIKVGYREFGNGLARAAFSNEVEYDLAASNEIGYSGARLIVHKATNTQIEYELVQNFDSPEIEALIREAEEARLRREAARKAKENRRASRGGGTLR